jgi:hypothetical protein
VSTLIAKGEDKIAAILDMLREDIKTCKPYPLRRQRL